ncbi:MAG: response regulator [Chloroflexota bacterium]
MAKNILIIDTQQAFSTILAEGLNNHEAFSAAVVASSTTALETIVEKPVDLVIVDLDIDDVPPARLIKAIKEAKAQLPIMVTPGMGQDVPADVQQLDIAGVVPKPFFVGDLPKIVGDVLGLDLENEVPDLPPVSQEPEKVERPKRIPRSERRANRRASAPPPPPPSRSESRASRSRSRSRSRSSAPPETEEIVIESTLSSWRLERMRKNEDEIVEDLKDLSQEFQAEAILLTAGSELIATAGSMDAEQTKKLAQLVARSAAAAAEAAAFLGEREGRFEQSIHEGKQFRLYSYSLGEGVVLSLAVNTREALGILRHRTRQISEKLIEEYIY